MSRARTYTKMLGVGLIFCVGGPALVQYVRPKEGELFERFNPDLQKRNLETRDKRQENFDQFVTQLKEYSKSDKSIWEEAKLHEAKAKAEAERKAAREAEEARAQKEEMRRELEGK
ncbi:assembly factor cbp4 [Arachnomyces sp. PD_36]|nr:assembly factor cbp4 [Arachnomyces sp. PD_36]